MIDKLNAQGTQATAQAAPSERHAKMKEAAQAFEAVFLRQMIGSMRQASLGEDLLGGRAAEQFRELSDAETAKNMAAGDGIGIAQMLLRQFEGMESKK